MTIDYIRVPFEILQDSKLRDKQKFLLGLIISFDSKGLKMGNDGIGKLLMLKPDYVSQLITSLKRKKYIRIINPQSKYRRIYFEKNLNVEDVLLREKSQSKTVLLRGLARSTMRNLSNITKVTKEEEKKTPKTCVEKPTGKTLTGKEEVPFVLHHFTKQMSDTEASEIMGVLHG